jgi:hypothetical protein
MAVQGKGRRAQIKKQHSVRSTYTLVRARVFFVRARRHLMCFILCAPAFLYVLN